MDASLVERFDRTLEEYDVMHQISRHGAPIRMGDLAASLLVANSSCHRIVGRLVDAGLLERHKGERDRREVKVTLTDEGRRLHRAMATRHTRDIDAVFGHHLDSEELDVLTALLDRLGAAFSRSSEQQSS